MKKLLVSILTLGVVSAVAVGATRAYFTDTEEVLGNTIQTGRLNLDLNGEASSTFSLTDLVPGSDYTTPMKLEVYNTSLSTMPVKYRFYDRFVSQSVGGLYDKVNVIVRHTNAGTANPEAWPVVFTGKLKDLYVDSTSTAGIISSSLGVNITHVFYLQFQLDASAGNVFQGANTVFDLVADATQTNNTGWSQ